MVSWRPTRGKITLLDSEFTTPDDIQSFFEAQRVLGRGAFSEENVYEFEVAVAGRRRRVASVDDDGKVFRGIAVGDLLDKLSTDLRKVEVELAGAVRHGPIDLGSVEIGDDDLDISELAEDSAEHDGNTPSDSGENLLEESSGLNASGDVSDGAGAGGGGVARGDVDGGNDVHAPRGDTEAGEDDGVAGDALPRLDGGPMVLISDLPLSEVPVLARAERKTFGVLRQEGSRVIVSPAAIDLHRKLFPRPSFSIVLTLDSETRTHPMFIVRRDDMRLTWDWNDAAEPFSWIQHIDFGHDGGGEGSEPVRSGNAYDTSDANNLANSAASGDRDSRELGDSHEVSAREFVDSELGAGGVARLAVADLIDVTFAELRAALTADVSEGPRRILELFGLPSEVADVLYGEGDLGAIPGVRIVEPKPAASAFEETLAWEVAGEGIAAPDVAKVYREIYLKRPWLTSIVAAAQAAVGGGVFVAGLRPRAGQKRSKLAILTGAVLTVNAMSRIGVIEYIHRVLERNEVNRGE